MPRIAVAGSSKGHKTDESCSKSAAVALKSDAAPKAQTWFDNVTTDTRSTETTQDSDDGSADSDESDESGVESDDSYVAPYYERKARGRGSRSTRRNSPRLSNRFDDLVQDRPRETARRGRGRGRLMGAGNRPRIVAKQTENTVKEDTHKSEHAPVAGGDASNGQGAAKRARIERQSRNEEASDAGASEDESLNETVHLKRTAMQSAHKPKAASKGDRDRPRPVARERDVLQAAESTPCPRTGSQSPLDLAALGKAQSLRADKEKTSSSPAGSRPHHSIRQVERALGTSYDPINCDTDSDSESKGSTDDVLAWSPPPARAGGRQRSLTTPTHELNKPTDHVDDFVDDPKRDHVNGGTLTLVAAAGAGSGRLAASASDLTKHLASMNAAFPRRVDVRDGAQETNAQPQRTTAAMTLHSASSAPSAASGQTEDAMHNTPSPTQLDAQVTRNFEPNVDRYRWTSEGQVNSGCQKCRALGKTCVVNIYTYQVLPTLEGARYSTRDIPNRVYGLVKCDHCRGLRVAGAGCEPRFDAKTAYYLEQAGYDVD